MNAYQFKRSEERRWSQKRIESTTDWHESNWRSKVFQTRFDSMDGTRASHGAESHHLSWGSILESKPTTSTSAFVLGASGTGKLRYQTQWLLGRGTRPKFGTNSFSKLMGLVAWRGNARWMHSKQAWTRWLCTQYSRPECDVRSFSRVLPQERWWSPRFTSTL